MESERAWTLIHDEQSFNFILWCVTLFVTFHVPNLECWSFWQNLMFRTWFLCILMTYRVILRSGRRFDQHFKYLQQVSSTHFGRRYFPIWGEDTCWRYSGDQIWWRYLFFELKDTSQSLGWPFHSLWGDQRCLKFLIWWRYLNVSYCPKNRDLISESLPCFRTPTLVRAYVHGHYASPSRKITL